MAGQANSTLIEQCQFNSIVKLPADAGTNYETLSYFPVEFPLECVSLVNKLGISCESPVQDEPLIAIRRNPDH